MFKPRQLIPFLLLLIGYSSLSGKKIAIVGNGRDLVKVKRNTFGSSNLGKRLDKNALDATNKYKEEYQFDQVSKVSKAKDFENAVKKAVKELKCGDTFVISLFGHGTKGGTGSFHFMTSDVNSKVVSAAQLREWLADLAPCVKVFVSIQSCHSGKFLESMQGDPHVVAAGASSDSRHVCYLPSDKNWGRGFINALNPNNESFYDDFINAILKGTQQSNLSALNRRANPTMYLRGHIESAKHDKKGVLLILKNPLAPGKFYQTYILYKKSGKENTTDDDRIKIKKLHSCLTIGVFGPSTLDEGQVLKASRVLPWEFQNAKGHVAKKGNSFKRTGQILLDKIESPSSLASGSGRAFVFIDPGDKKLMNSIEVCQTFTFKMQYYRPLKPIPGVGPPPYLQIRGLR